MNPDAALPTECPNCGASLEVDPHPHYCPLCGQETHLHPPSFGEFVHEFIGHYVALEGALWRTLAALLLHPGKLTREYLDGRRRRYVLPLRVYLSASFLFFLVVKFIGVGAGPALQVGAGDGTRAPVVVDAGSASELKSFVDRCAPPGACGWFETRLSRAVGQLSGADGARTVGERMSGAAPYAVFLMVPVFAALLQGTWRRAGLTYGAHFVLALHLHAVAFLVLLLAALLPVDVGGMAIMLILVHGTLAMHRVYAAPWRATIARAAAVGLIYGTLLTLGTLLLAVAVLLATGA